MTLRLVKFQAAATAVRHASVAAARTLGAFGLT
jgi:hypothetical protein